LNPPAKNLHPRVDERISSVLGIGCVVLNSGLPPLPTRNEVASIGASVSTGRLISITSSRILIVTVVSRNLPHGSPTASALAMIYPSDVWLSDQQRAFDKRYTLAANAVPKVVCAESSDRSARINRGTVTLAGPRSADLRKRRIIVRCAILCFLCPATLGAGLVGGALIAQNQPISVLEPGGFALEAPRFFAVEANAGQVAPLALVHIASDALPRLAM
jgi:hypothetical protein